MTTQTQTKTIPNCQTCTFRDCCSFRQLNNYDGCIQNEAYVRSLNNAPMRNNSFSYTGLEDDREQLNEWVFENYQDESHYVGFEVGDQ